MSKIIKAKQSDDDEDNYVYGDIIPPGMENLSPSERQIAAKKRLEKLPPATRKLFEMKRQKLIDAGLLSKDGRPVLKKDLLKAQENFMASQPAISGETQAQMIMYSILFAILAFILHSQYKINIFHEIGQFIKNALDPGVDPASKGL